MKRKFLKIPIVRSFTYRYYYQKIKELQDDIQWNYGTALNKTKRATLWYMATENIDHVFYKVYGLWGIDSLTEDEKKKVNLK